MGNVVDLTAIFALRRIPASTGDAGAEAVLLRRILARTRRDCLLVERVLALAANEFEDDCSCPAKVLSPRELGELNKVNYCSIDFSRLNKPQSMES